MTHIVTVRRHFAAPPDRVYAAWTTPALFARWIGPVGVPCAVLAMDPTEGGGFRLEMTPANGHVIQIEGRFTCLIPHERIEFTWTAEWSAAAQDGAGGLKSHVTVLLRPTSDGTDMEFLHHLPDSAMVDSHRRGWTSTFDKLQQTLET